MVPALVLSPGKYNRKAGLAVVCPITSWIKPYPFNVPIRDGFEISGMILSDQVSSLDWRKRRADFICALDTETLDDVLMRISALLFQ